MNRCEESTPWLGGAPDCASRPARFAQRCPRGVRLHRQLSRLVLPPRFQTRRGVRRLRPLRLPVRLPLACGRRVLLAPASRLVDGAAALRAVHRDGRRRRSRRRVVPQPGQLRQLHRRRGHEQQLPVGGAAPRLPGDLRAPLHRAGLARRVVGARLDPAAQLDSPKTANVALTLLFSSRPLAPWYSAVLAGVVVVITPLWSAILPWTTAADLAAR